MPVTEHEIKALYNNWRQAVIVNDIQFLEQLFSDDFISIRNVGKPKNKVDELLWLGVRNVQYLYWEDKNISIDTTGNNGFVTCNQTLNVLIYDLPAKIDREIMLTFVKQDKELHLQQFQENPARFT